ncbi:hypothetical protein BJ875DRAFT_498223 [Amylocarpus encephaloides]|uniref:Uncharacterized protein n=1 Tax=Amylocarpus encephaloides TaxID=45428 RepID=A0A9P7YED9_9HELO|nr:hypothetical protein BJ875DRAFT_498223 [Amylocarpus encephaloides]
MYSGYLPPKAFTKKRKAKSRRGLEQTFMGIALLALVTAAPWLILFVLTSTVSSDSVSFACPSDHDLGWVFEPSVTYGNFTLAQAKLVDASFDMVFGRGLQAIIAYVSYRVTVASLIRVMETTLVPFELVSTLAFHSVSTYTIVSLFRGAFALEGWRPKMIMIWLFISSFFVIAFPTLADVMSTYKQSMDLFLVSPENSTMVPYPNPGELRFKAYHSLPDNLACAPSPSNRYQWGFGFIWILITWCTFSLWLLGTYSLWMDAQHNSDICRKGRTMNLYRATLDLSGAMKEALGEDTTAYSGKELKKALEKKPSIMYQSEINEETGTGHLKLTAVSNGKMKNLDWDVVYCSGGKKSETM